MKIAVACDHGGLNLKREIIEFIKKSGHEPLDFGTDGFGSCDYPDFALPAAEAVACGKCERGIVVCSSGIGVSIVANKVPGIRCAHCHDTYCAEFTRLHNDANMLALGGGIVGPNLAVSIVETFLNTPFSEEEKHKRRVAML